MAKMKPKSVVPVDTITAMLHIVRGQRVMLDEDLARLYGVATKVLNQAVERNIDRFPIEFSYVMTQEEFTNLRSQIVTSSSTYGGRRYPPRVFTEHGVAMLSSVLRSNTAAKVNIEIIRTFVRLRRLLATPGEIVTQLQQLTETVKLHDDQIKVISQILQKMLQPPAVKDGRQIGFHNIPAKKD